MKYQEYLLNLIKTYNSHLNLGMNSTEVNDYLIKYGTNTLIKQTKISPIIRFFSQFKDFLVIILLIASIISVIIDPYDWVDSLIILIVVFINGLLGFIQETSAEKALNALASLSTPQAKVTRDGQMQIINASNLIPGDIIHLTSGDYVPADAQIINCHNLLVDESSLTGESQPVRKYLNEEWVKIEVLSEKHDELFASTYVTSGTCDAIVIKTGMTTEIGKIAKLLAIPEITSTPLQIKLAQMGKVIGIICLSLCLIILILKIILGNSIKDSFITAIALAVAAIPEGLATIVTVILAIGVNKMAKKQAIVKKLPAVETLGCAAIICTDKTGTLTTNKMTVTYCYSNTLKSINDKLSIDDLKLLELMAMCTNAKVEYQENQIKEIGDPTELALINARNIYVENPLFNNYERFYELPFDANRKMMTVIYKHLGKYLIITKGALEALCDKVINKNFAHQALSINNTMSQKALRVLGLAYKELLHLPKDLSVLTIENNLHFVGLVGMIDPPKEGVKEAIEEATKAGIKTVMITGDHPLTALAIAKELGIYTINDLVLTSQEFNQLNDEELNQCISRIRVLARANPEDKVRLVKSWQKKDQVVAMTGDGINDSPALKQAEIGCAMGITGTDVAKEAADLILVDDNFATIVEAVKEGRNVYANIKKVVKFLLSSNIGEVFTILFSLCLFTFFANPLFDVEGPLLAIHLLWVNLITDSLPAFALGCEKNSDSLMSGPPRPKNEHFFANHLFSIVFFEGFMVGILTLIAYYVGQTYNHQIAQTMAFITLSTTQLFHAFNNKSERSILNKHFFDNVYLLIAFIGGFILQLLICYLPRLSKVFKVVSLPIDLLLICLGLSFSSIIIVEFFKLIKNSKKKTISS